MNDLILKLLLACVLIAIGGLPFLYKNKANTKVSVKSHADKVRELCKPRLKEKKQQ